MVNPTLAVDATPSVIYQSPYRFHPRTSPPKKKKGHPAGPEWSGGVFVGVVPRSLVFFGLLKRSTYVVNRHTKHQDPKG